MNSEKSIDDASVQESNNIAGICPEPPPPPGAAAIGASVACEGDGADQCQ